ncbi:hypothetical protein BC828DRAFT_394223, partial [Blastocladiella britannica]
TNADTAQILETSISGHASACTRIHALYAYFTLGYSARKVGRVLKKAPATVTGWIRQFKRGNHTQNRSNRPVSRKFGSEKRQWLVNFFKMKPVSYLEEAQAAYRQRFLENISISSVWRIIYENGLRWKVLVLQHVIL